MPYDAARHLIAKVGSTDKEEVILKGGHVSLVAGANAAALPDFDTFWQTGYLEIPAASEEYVIFGDFRADPEKHKLRTPSGKIELYSEKIAGFGYADCPGHPAWLAPQDVPGLAAAMGGQASALGRLDQFIRRRNEIADRYRVDLGDAADPVTLVIKGQELDERELLRRQVDLLAAHRHAMVGNVDDHIAGRSGAGAAKKKDPAARVVIDATDITKSFWIRSGVFGRKEFKAVRGATFKLRLPQPHLEAT